MMFNLISAIKSTKTEGGRAPFCSIFHHRYATNETPHVSVGPVGMKMAALMVNVRLGVAARKFFGGWNNNERRGCRPGLMKT